MKLGTINHIALTASQLERSEGFYNRFLAFLGYQQLGKTENLIVWTNGACLIALYPANRESRNQHHDRYSPGLHHLAFSADSREQVDQLYQLLLEWGSEILDPPAEYDYVPGYYAVFFLDPDGIKLELTYAPNWPPGANG